MDALRERIEAGQPVETLPVSGGMLDLSNRDDVAAGADRLEHSPVRL